MNPYPFRNTVNRIRPLPRADIFEQYEAGLVPPPNVLDLTKFLRSDGTWAVPSGGGGGGFTPPTGTGFAHVTSGALDAAAKLVVNADVDAAAAIVESKLSLNYATHSNSNDPSSGEKAALVGTSGTPGAGNKYVTDQDVRLDTFTTSQIGLVPNPVSSTGKFLKDDGTWATVTATVPDASESVKGIVELATSAETTAGLAVQASDTRLSDARTPTGSASGDLDGTYPSPSVASVTQQSGDELSLTIGDIPDGKVLARSGTEIVGTVYKTESKYWDVGATTSLTTGVIAGPTFSSVQPGTYWFHASGWISTAAAATGPRPFLNTSDTLVVSSMSCGSHVFSTANTLISAYSSALGSVPLINNGSTAGANFFMDGELTVSTSGTLEVWIASEGTNNVTLHRCIAHLQRIN